jgi:hypothetical protein
MIELRAAIRMWSAYVQARLARAREGICRISFKFQSLRINMREVAVIATSRARLRRHPETICALKGCTLLETRRESSSSLGGNRQRAVDANIQRTTMGVVLHPTKSPIALGLTVGTPRIGSVCIATNLSYGLCITLIDLLRNMGELCPIAACSRYSVAD